MSTYTITTAKGTFTASSLRAVCEWQAENQGAFATLKFSPSVAISTGAPVDIEVSVDDVDFDAENIHKAVSACESLLSAEA
jgi:hypothetical protein